MGPAWTFWRGVVLLGFDTPDPAGVGIRHGGLRERLADYEVTGVLPLMKVVGDGNIIWGLDKSGTRPRWYKVKLPAACRLYRML